jgi:hypothetical protein
MVLLVTASAPPEAYFPFVVLCLSLAVLYVQFGFIVLSTWVKSCSSFEIRPDSDKTLLKWQLLATGLGFISTAAGSMFWAPNLTDDQCRRIAKVSHFFFFLSLSVLYYFYDARLTVIRIAEKRSRLDIALLCMASLHLIMGIVVVSLVNAERTEIYGGVYCLDDVPIWAYVFIGLLGLVLNPAYLYMFLQPLKDVGLHISAQRRKSPRENQQSAERHFKEIVMRNKLAALISTTGIAGLAIVTTFVGNIWTPEFAPNLVFTSLRAVQTSLWCTCMFICTISIWQKKSGQISNPESQVNRTSSVPASPAKKLSSPQVEFQVVQLPTVQPTSNSNPESPTGNKIEGP